jgi:Transglycosylase SLT domain
MFFVKKISVLLLFIFSCSQKQFQSQLNAASNTLDSNKSAAVPDSPVPPIGSYKFEPLAWEAKNVSAQSWSNTVYKVIQTEEPQMLGQNVADDIETFCPKYRSLSDSQRLNFWGQLLAGMSKFESGWNPASYYVETTMGIDPVTGRQVASEGLLQLSYQDQKSYNLNCGFDWSIDTKFSNTDARKSIFDPHKNLRCGIKILAKQLTRQRAISTTTGVYWAVLKTNGKYTKVPEIAAITKTLSFCK